MSEEGSEGWETTSERSDQGDQGNADISASQQVSGLGTVPETELSFSKKSPEEVEKDAASVISRASSISSRLGCLSISGLTSLPHQSPPQQPQSSPSPERRAPRNPVSDTWRDEAYTKKDSGKGKMIDVAKQQDRWRCEYCGHLNNVGVVNDASEVKVKGSIQIPGSIGPGIAPGEVVKCANCGEQMFLELTRYDPREEAEDGVRWNAVQDPDEVKALRREVLKGTALNRVRERWREDEKRRQEEESEKKKEDEVNVADQGADDEWEDED